MMLSTSFLLLLLAICVAGNEGRCPESDQIRCKENRERCTRIRYICDGDNDCGDHSDENDELCRAWTNRDCDRNSARCYRFGSSDCVPIVRYCELTDPPCDGDVDPRLCQMLRDGRIQDLDSIDITPQHRAIDPEEGMSLELAEALGERFLSKVPVTLSHKDCPPLFTKVADVCVSIFHPGNVTFGEAQQFCHTIGGKLLELNRGYSFYATLVQHLIQHELTADFWLGGVRRSANDSWTWLDESPISDTLPYWALRFSEECLTRTAVDLPGIPSIININNNNNQHRHHNNYHNGTDYYDNRNTTTVTTTTVLANQGHCYHFKRAPYQELTVQCLALTYESYFNMADVNCLARKSPLCVAK